MTEPPHASNHGPNNGLNPLALFTLEIETQRRQLDMAMSIVDACRLANDSALLPMYAPLDPQEDDDGEAEGKDGDREDQDNRFFPPEADLEGALAMVWIILNGVSAQLEHLMFKTFEDAVASPADSGGRRGTRRRDAGAGTGE